MARKAGWSSGGTSRRRSPQTLPVSFPIWIVTSQQAIQTWIYFSQQINDHLTAYTILQSSHSYMLPHISIHVIADSLIYWSTLHCLFAKEPLYTMHASILSNRFKFSWEKTLWYVKVHDSLSVFSKNGAVNKMTSWTIQTWFDSR